MNPRKNTSNTSIKSVNEQKHQAELNNATEKLHTIKSEMIALEREVRSKEQKIIETIHSEPGLVFEALARGRRAPRRQILALNFKDFSYIMCWKAQMRGATLKKSA